MANRANSTLQHWKVPAYFIRYAFYKISINKKSNSDILFCLRTNYSISLILTILIKLWEILCTWIEAMNTWSKK